MPPFDPLALLRPRLAERYAVEREVGRGGMAVVYRALDLKHHRRVALKVLDPELGAVLGADRFLTEIRTTANLQHPNLLPLFDSGEVDGLLYYVMPFVEGESLRARLDREKQLPIAEAIRIATALAAALDYAHRQGVIHRDLKPENVLLHDGQPLIADFGIALAVQQAGGQRVTQTGLSLGTPQYMAPEQATGDCTIDGRADVYALGAVTYEMLAGEPPHVGRTAQAIIAKLMTEEPRALSTVRHTVPEYVDDAVHRALEKLPADRFATAKEFADTLAGRGPATSGAVAIRRARALPPSSRLRRVLASPLWFAAFLAAVGAAAAAWVRRAPVQAESTVRFMLADTTGVIPDAYAQFAFSPDGRTIVFTGRGGADTVYRLYARPLNAVVTRALPGTEGATAPVFSPDGQWIAFQSGGDVRKVRLDGQQLTTLARIGSSWGGMSWGVQNRIVVAHDGQLWAVAEAGGTPTRIAAQDTVSLARLFPLTLGNGKAVVYTEWHGSITNSTLNVLSLESGEVKRLGVAGSSPVAIVDDRLVYLDPNGNLATIGFDPRSGRTSGNPTVVIPDVQDRAGQVQAAISGTGDLVYVSGRTQRQLVVANADSVRAPLVPPNASPAFPRWSPDGRFIAVGSRLSGSHETWIYSLGTGTFTQLTHAREGVNSWEWAPDGKHILFITDSGGLWTQPVGGGAATKIMTISGPISFSVSPDGNTIAYRTGTETGRKLWYRSIVGDTATHPLDAGPAALEPRFSPDGQWIAYTGGDLVVYIARFPDLSDRQRISLESGRDPVWAPGMRRLYYSAPGGTVMAADLSGGSHPTVTRREKILVGTYVLGRGRPGFDVARDGSVALVREQRANGRTVVVQGWKHELSTLTR